jgi:nucleotide-binding universal stress UspA family protein
MKTIVVGVDGSKDSLAAVQFAAEEAASRQARLLAVAAWEIPPNALLIAGAVPGFLESARQDAEQVVQTALARAKQVQPEISCEGKVAQGHPGRVLVEEAQEAMLVVVGSRGRGGFASLVLGSVSLEVVLHAPCSVVVVRPRPAPYGEQDPEEDSVAVGL